MPGGAGPPAPRPEADAGRRRPADLLDQAVVAPAATDRVLRTDRLVFEFERRARVVVEAAHECRLKVVGDAVRVEERAHASEVLPAFTAQRLADLRRAGKHGLHTI